MKPSLLLVVALCALVPAGAQSQDAGQAQPARPVRIGIVTFLSGAAAGPFGVPARNAAEVLVESINNGKAPAPYSERGLGGAPIELVFIDEAGGTAKQVSEYRDLVQRQNVDVVIGYISSGDCLAVAPLAEELKKLTIFFDCGTPRIFEDQSYKYLFRTAGHAALDSAAAALYVAEAKPALKRVAGINQNYAWGQDSWNDFEAAIKGLVPGVEIVTSQMPKFLSGQYGAEISALLTANPEVVHSSLWGGDLEAFVLQAGPRGLFKKSMVVLTAGEHAMYRLTIPDGTVVGARGSHGVFAPENELNGWLRAIYHERYGLLPVYPAYHMSQALLGLKAAWEKAKGAGAPDTEKVIAAFEGLTFDTPTGPIKMALGKGHQAIEPAAYGTAKTVGGKLTFVNVRRYPAERVNPPEGTKSAEWIKNLKAAK